MRPCPCLPKEVPATCQQLQAVPARRTIRTQLTIFHTSGYVKLQRARLLSFFNVSWSCLGVGTLSDGFTCLQSFFLVCEKMQGFKCGIAVPDPAQFEGDVSDKDSNFVCGSPSLMADMERTARRQAVAVLGRYLLAFRGCEPLECG